MEREKPGPALAPFNPDEKGDLNHALIRHSSELVNIIDGAGHILYVGPSITKLLGYHPRELVGRRPIEFVHPDDAPTMVETFRALQAKRGAVIGMCVRLRHKNGSWRWMDGCGQNLLDDPAVRGIVSSSHDVTEQRTLQDAARESERRFRVLVENAADAVILTDASGRIAYASPTVEQVLGFLPTGESVKALLSAFHLEDVASVTAAFARAGRSPTEPVIVEARFSVAAAPRKWAHLSLVNRLADGVLAGIVIRVRDITAEKEMRAEIEQSRRMDAVGRLAGGVAHEFNNLLTVIAFYSDSLLQSARAENIEELAEIKRAARRAIEATRQLLAFSRQQIFRKTEVIVDVLVENALRPFAGELPSEVTVTTALDCGAAAVKADPSMIVEVIRELLLNARKALGAGGAIHLDTAIVEVHTDTGKQGMRSGTYAAISIEDSGASLSPETRTRLFEPFFHAPGRGPAHGIGLSAVYGIVKQSGGELLATSDGPAGAKFTVLLPVSNATEISDPAAA